MENDYDQLIQGNTPEEKIKNAIGIIETLEKETFKLRADFKRSEATIKKLQESATLTAQNQHNTSSAFSLPSEFKKSWEVLVQENILDLFSPFLNNHKNLAVLVRELIKCILELEAESIDLKVAGAINLLGCAKTYTDSIKKHLLRLFQDHHTTAFPVINLETLRKNYLNKLPIGLHSEVKGILNAPELETFVKNMHKISLHMLLNDPKLEIPFSDSLEYVILEKPDDYYCIDGFPNGSPRAVVVVPSVFRNNYPYNGIKPSVLIISNENSPETPKTSKETDTIPNEKDPTPKKNLIKELSPSQVIDLYTRYKKNVNKNKYEDNQDSYPPLQRKIKDTEGPKCTQCKGSMPCGLCSKYNLLALVKKSSHATTSQRNLTPGHPYINSVFEVPNKSQTRTMTSLLTKRLSEAAKKMDRKAFIKNKHIDKESCKVM